MISASIPRRHCGKTPLRISLARHSREMVKVSIHSSLLKPSFHLAYLTWVNLLQLYLMAAPRFFSEYDPEIFMLSMCNFLARKILASVVLAHDHDLSAEISTLVSLVSEIKDSNAFTRIGVLWPTSSRLSAKARNSIPGWLSCRNAPKFHIRMKRAVTLSGSPSGNPVVDFCSFPKNRSSEPVVVGHQGLLTMR